VKGPAIRHRRPDGHLAWGGLSDVLMTACSGGDFGRLQMLGQHIVQEPELIVEPDHSLLK
jgi:hypothetical protein